MTPARTTNREQTHTPARILSDQISDQLGEKEFGPRRLVQSIVEVCGAEFAQQMLQEAQEIEAQGGMLLLDGTRRRTTGGVFFYLARGRMSAEARKAVFPTRAKRKTGAKPKPQPSFDWSDRLSFVPALLEEKGVLDTVKVTLIGRPGKVDIRKDLVVTTMTHTAKTATLPKGVPQPPQTPTHYTVYIALKQWNKVAESINDPKDALIIEGLCAYDNEIGTIAVFAQSTTTKQLEANKREAQRQKTEGANGEAPANGESAPKPAKAPKAAASDSAADALPKVQPQFAIPIGASATDAQKLRELHSAANLYRDKITDMEAKNQRFGIDMTQKLLKTVEDQIKAIEQKYA